MDESLEEVQLWLERWLYGECMELVGVGLMLEVENMPEEVLGVDVVLMLTLSVVVGPMGMKMMVVVV